MKLCDPEFSGNCYKARLLAASLGIELEIVPVDFMSGAHKAAAFRKLIRLGRSLSSLTAILCCATAKPFSIYLARLHGGDADGCKGSRARRSMAVDGLQ